MIDFDYLYKGICGLGRAHQGGTMAGHLGAAVAAGYFFGEDQSELPDGVYRGVEGELDRIMAGEEDFWYDAKEAGVAPSELFKPFPKETAVPEKIPSIVKALQGNIGSLKQSGHNTIFGSIAVRALHDHEEYATPQIINGICKLMEAFNSVPPGRGYYGEQKGWISGSDVELPQDDSFPPYQSISEMVDVTIQELIKTASVHLLGYGSLWHIINHAAAITELDRFGYKDVARQALPAHHEHIRYWRTLPDVEKELGPVVKASHDPREAIYWDGRLKRDEARLTHRVKTLYGFYTILPFIQDEKVRAQAQDAFLYLMD